MKKIIAPIVVTAIIVLYFVLYFGIFIYLIESLVLKLILAIVPLALCAVIIYVCVERIKEIRSGEEDDLSKY